MLDDELWMARAACGDVNAFGLVVKAHQERLQRFARRMLGGDREAAIDVVQDSFIRVWQSRAAYTAAGPGSLTAFLLRVVRNVCIDHLRANKKWDIVRIDEDVPFTGPSCEVSALTSALHEAIGLVLLRLPEAQRVVYVLSEYEGLSYQEISEVIGCPFGTVASRKRAVVEALRAELRSWLGGEEE